MHRNIANILHPGDVNATSVITYAVNVLKVRDIVVCGHSLCGGVHAALGNDAAGGVLDSWLLPLRGLRQHLAATQPAWSGLTVKEKERKLVEANVRAGVQTLLRNADVIRAMEANPSPPPSQQDLSLQVHGAVYDIEKGAIYELNVEEGDAERANRLAAFKTI